MLLLAEIRQVQLYWDLLVYLLDYHLVEEKKITFVVKLKDGKKCLHQLIVKHLQNFKQKFSKV